MFEKLDFDQTQNAGYFLTEGVLHTNLDMYNEVMSTFF
jgi:hypothetical protein